MTIQQQAAESLFQLFVVDGVNVLARLRTDSALDGRDLFVCFLNGLRTCGDAEPRPGGGREEGECDAVVSAQKRFDVTNLLSKKRLPDPRCFERPVSNDRARTF